MNYLKQNHLALLIIAYLIAAPFLMGKEVKLPDLGSSNALTTITNRWRFSTEGSQFSRILHGTCNLTINSGYLSTTNASNTMQATCAVTGVDSGDVVFVSMPRASLIGNQGVRVGFWAIATEATSTDLIGVTIFNGSGAATTSFPLATTSVQYLIFDTP